MKPLVSVVIPAYNPSRAILEAVESALAQSVRDLEVIVVDDGSTQDLAWLREAFGDRILLVRKPNGGPASARNEGIRRAQGEYVAFLDADDMWESQKTARQLEVFRRHPQTGLVYSAASEIDVNGRLLRARRRHEPGPSGRIVRPLFWRNVISTSTAMVRRACFEEAGLFDEDPQLISVEDYDMWLRLAERYEARFVDATLVRYRLHPGGISRNVARSYLGEQRVIEKAVARHAGDPWVRRVLPRRLAQLFFDCGHEHFSLGDFSNARAYFGKSLRHRPLHPIRWGYWAGTFLGPAGVRLIRALKRSFQDQPSPPWAHNGHRRPIRVLHVLYSVDTGGAEHVALNLARHGDPSRTTLQVCSLTGRGRLAPAFEAIGAPVTAMNKRPGVDLWIVLRLARLISRAGIDVVHTHNVTPWLYAGVAARLAGARLVHTEHSNLFPHQRRLMAAERWLARLTDVIISDSDKVRRGLLSQRLPEERIHTIVNGIDTARFAGREPAQALRASVRLAPGQPVLGAVGRLAPVKDHETLLRAFSEVLRRKPEAVLVLVGDGPQRAPLEQLARQLGVAQAVRFAGEVPDVAPWLALLDVFVLPSRSEGMPLTLLEAMAAGVPAVATRVGGIAEALLDGETGLLVPPKDPQALAQALLRLLGDEPLRKRLGAQAQQRAREAFDVRTMVRAYEDTYHHELVP